MRLLARLLLAAVVAAPAVLAFLLWDATGRAGWTRYRDADRAEREAAAAEESLADLFEDTGVNDELGALDTVPNEFALGMLPSGGGRHLVSLATIAVPSLLGAAWILLAPAVRRRREDRPAPPTE